MIELVYNNAGDIILLRIDGVPYTEDALKEQLAWAKKRRESDRRAGQRYEEQNRVVRNARRAAQRGAK